MAVRTKVEPIDRDIELMLRDTLSREAQTKAFAEFAHEQIEDAKATNKRILGRVPRHTITVDGREGAPLQSVQPNGVVVAEFELLNDVLAWIGEQLVLHSPVGETGRYARSHVLYADGTETTVGAMLPVASEYVFLNVQPYARKIELGSSSQAPDGVYQGVAIMARRRFANVAKIGFSYRTALSGSIIGGAKGNKSATRQPAIIVTVR